MIAPLGAELQPVDPTATGEAEATRVVREALKRKRDEADAEADALRAAPSAASSAPPAVPAAPTAPPPKTCVHEVALPAGFAGDREALLAPRFTGERAKQYPFTLDPFQETAIACLVRRAVRATPRCWRCADTHGPHRRLRARRSAGSLCWSRRTRQRARPSSQSAWRMRIGAQHAA